MIEVIAALVTTKHLMRLPEFQGFFFTTEVGLRLERLSTGKVRAELT
jgi:hypothetical protein